MILGRARGDQADGLNRGMLRGDRLATINSVNAVSDKTSRWSGWYFLNDVILPKSSAILRNWLNKAPSWPYREGRVIGGDRGDACSEIGAGSGRNLPFYPTLRRNR